MNYRFLHTGDWHLGMAGGFFKEDAQARYTQARFDAVRTLGRVAREARCQFVVVCGDAFDHNQVDKKTVLRAIEALKEVPVPVYILPGNHDTLDAGSVYRSLLFVQQKPDHVHVVQDSQPISVLDGLELVGAPWTTKRPTKSPLEEVITALSPEHGLARICIGHGAVDYFAPRGDAGEVIDSRLLDQAVTDGRAQYIGLSDRHSIDKIGTSGRIWYSGTPEPTRYDESRPGFAILVDLNPTNIHVEEVRIARWQFIDRGRIDINTADDVESLRLSLDDIKDKEYSRLRFDLVGTVSLSLYTSLKDCLDDAEHVLGGLDVTYDNLHVLAADTDFSDLGFSGFADGTVKRLRAKLEEGGVDGDIARDSLMLLLRLAKEKK